MATHWLLYTSDMEHGGTLILGIFDTEEDAWAYYSSTHDDNDQYYRIPFVECWENSTRIYPGENKEKENGT